MARKLTGAVVEHTGRDGRTYRSLRFTAYGKRRFVSLGSISESEAQVELRHLLADLERGKWTPPQAVEAPPEPERVPTFHEFAEQWWIRNEGQLRPSTQVDYKWRIEKHLLPFFADHRLDQISFDLVERYIAAKLAATEPLSPRSINMTLTLMAAILEGAVDRELISRNPAKGKRRRAREHEPRRSYLDTAETSRRCLTPRVSWTELRGRIVGTSSVVRSSRRSSSPARGSANCAGCGGVTWTSRAGGCTSATPRRTRAFGG